MQGARAQRSFRPLLFVGLSAICLVFAYHRSFWTDELVRLKQSELGLLLGLKSLFSEPSPFSPGEILLNWLSRTLFGTILPPELWGRIPGTLWVLGTFWISLEISRKRSFRYLPWFVFFSVSLLTVSVQMRPYGALIFCGAVAADLVLNDKDRESESSRRRRTFSWIALLFGHIYGICLVALACLLTQRIVRAIFGLLYMGFILALCTIQVTQPGPVPDGLKLLSIIVFAIGNPHHASFLLAPLAALGILWLYRSEPAKTWKLFAVLVVATAAPVLIDLSYRYFFAPRQVLAGIVPFLAFCSLGLDFLLQRFRSQGLQFATVAGIFTATLFLPWTLSILLKEPPVTDQPMHQFRELAQEIAHERLRSVFFLDPCNLGSLEYYVDSAVHAGPGPRTEFESLGIPMQQLCWSGKNTASHLDLCITSPRELKYCWMKQDHFLTDPLAGYLTTDASRYERVVHEFPRFPALGLPAAQTIRAW